MGQRSKGITIILKLLARGEANYISRFKLVVPLLIILFSVLSIYNPYINNMDIILFGVKKQGFYILNNSNETIYLCNVTPIIYLGDGNTLFGFNNKSNCTSFLGITICPNINCKESARENIVPSSIVLRSYLKSSIDNIIGLIKLLVITILAVSIFMLSYENTVTSSQLISKLKYWRLNVRIVYIVWSLLSITVLTFISMSIGVVIATISGFISSLLISTIYMKPLISLNDVFLVYLSLSLSSLLGTIIGLKGLGRCCT